MSGRMVAATDEATKVLTAPDVELVALAFNLAEQLDDPDTRTAAAAKEYRATMAALRVAQAPKAMTLDDLDDD